MKKSVKVLTILSVLVLFAGADTFGHGYYNVRSSCKWWRPKYKAFARVSMGAILTNSKTVSNCSAAIAERNNGCAYQYARAASYGNFLYGSVYHSPWFCSRGLPLSGLTSDDNLSLMSSQLVDEAEINGSDVLFSERTVSFELQKVRLMLAENGRMNEFRISLWQPQDDDVKFIEDTIRTQSKTLIDAYVRINSDLSVDIFNLPKSAVTVHRYQDSTVVLIEDLSIVWDLPNHINGLSNELAVMFDSFGEIVEQKSSESNEHEKIEVLSHTVSLYPNPTGDFLNIEVADDKINHLILLNLEGRVLNHWNIVPTNKAIIDLNQLGIKPGTYIVLMYSENRQYRQKFIFK